MEETEERQDEPVHTGIARTDDAPPEPVTEPEIPEKEPGGDSPEDVYARKEYRTRKKVEAELQQERIEKARLEERLRTLEQVKTEKPAEKIYTPEEVQAFIDAGQLKPAVGAAYLAKIQVDAALAANEEKHRQQAPIVQARAKIAEYVKLVPELQDPTSDEFKKAAVEFNELVSQGYADDDRTRVVAIKMAHGDLAMLQKRAAARDQNRQAQRLPVDGSGGNGNGNRAVTFDSAPENLKKYYQGSGMTKPEQERHFKKWQERQKSK